MEKDDHASRRTLTVPEPFSLATTCGPVHWTTGRSPRHGWHDGALTWIGWEGNRIAWRTARQVGRAGLDITGHRSPNLDAEWGRRVLGSGIALPRYDDSVIAEIAGRHPGLHPYCDGSVFEGVVTAIVGQSISVAAAAVTQARLAALFAEPILIGVHEYRPLPRPDQLADASDELVRSSGVTWKRAGAIRFAAQEYLAGNLPADQVARERPEVTIVELMKLPLVGRWTAESVVLWGVGAPNAHPTGDVALLRAARLAYERPDLTLKDLDVLAEQWQPARGLAARLLWTDLFGPAPDPTRRDEHCDTV
jgi:3-methyladenine DNA glycosylase/8-oxoguanine DNA glycosylase